MDEKPMWHYKPKTHEPEGIASAIEDLLEDEDDPLTTIDIDDDYGCLVESILSCKDGKEVLVACTDEPIHIDYNKKEIKLPKVVCEIYHIEDRVPASRIRYSCFPVVGADGTRNSGKSVVLSVWNEARDIVNIQFVTDAFKSTLLLVNAMSRLIYEVFEKNIDRTHKFFRLCEGLVDVAICSTSDRDKIDKANSPGSAAAGGAMNNGKMNEKLPVLNKKPMYFVLDEEALLLYEHSFSTEPMHDFRFYRESSKWSIDTIFVCHVENQLEIEQDNSVYFIQSQQDDKQSVTSFEFLVTLFQTGQVKPKPKTAFEGSGKDFENIFNGEWDKDFDGSSSSESEVESDHPVDILKTISLDKLKSDPVVREQVPDKPEILPPVAAVATSNDAADKSIACLRGVETGGHLFVGVDEEKQIKWFEIEAVIERLIKAGKVPRTDVKSSGIDVQSTVQFKQVVDDIKMYLENKQWEMAVSRMRSCLALFGKTLLSDVKGVGEVELLKRIYFLTD